MQDCARPRVCRLSDNGEIEKVYPRHPVQNDESTEYFRVINEQRGFKAKRTDEKWRDPVDG